MSDKPLYEYSTGGKSKPETFHEEQRRLAIKETIRVGCIIHIGEQKIKDVIALKIEQKYGDHHRMELKIYASEVQESNAMYMDGTEKLLGQVAMVSILNVNNKMESKVMNSNFIVTHVKLGQNMLNDGTVTITGLSATYLLDGAPHCETYVDKDVAYIVRNLTEPLERAKARLVCKPRTKGDLPFVCRFNETAWQLLKRMAANLGEFLYFNGKELIFGYPHSQEHTHIVYGKESAELNMDIELAVPQGYLHDYNSRSNTTTRYNLNQYKELGFGVNRKSMETGEHLFGLNTNTHTRGIVNEGSLLFNVSETRSIAMANRTYVVSGESKVWDMNVGQCMQLDMARAGQKNSHKLLRIMEVTHYYEAGGKYHNEYKATWGDMQTPPLLNYEQPITYPVLATVLNNTTENGRVKVEFLNWHSQTGSNETGFIRVATLSGGSSDKVSQNRGLVFIPEVGEQVWINFEQGSPEKPFVMSSAFHGRNGKGGEANNHIKSIITRSGCTIQFDDDDNKGSITVKDPSGSVWYMDGAGTIHANAPKDIILHAAKNIVMQAGENITSNAGMNISESAGKNHAITAVAMMTQNAGADYSLMAANILKIAKENISTSAKTATKQAKGDINIVSKDGNINKHAQKEIQNNSGEKSKMH